MTQTNLNKRTDQKAAKGTARRAMCVAAAALMLFCASSCARTGAKQEKETGATENAPVTAETTLPAEVPYTDPTVTASVPGGETTAGTPTVPAPGGETTVETPAAPTSPAPTVPTTEAPPTVTEPPAPAVPATKAAIVSFFAAAVNDVRFNCSASYDKVEHQKISDVNMTGNATVDGMIRDSIGSFAKDETTAEHVAGVKGTPSSGENMLGWGLADDSAVVSATLEESGGNYRITILMADEDTPDKATPRHLEAVGSVMFREDVEAALGSVPQIKEFSGIRILYTNYTITAELTPDGRLVSLRHHCDAEILLGHMKIVLFSLDNKSIKLENTVVYSGFSY
ncbi:MAG: hypothetical protein IK104_08150 [Clostridia bacterium]|nr:hypothetical protein [Clostridia bacterium]